jgi:inosine-uridine nucleoside N-ribohydrolase
MRTDPKTFARVGGVVWMGGTLEHAGNTSASAEFNCFADPYAAAEINDAAQAGLIKLAMAPLDITSYQDVPFTDLIHPSIIASAAAENKAKGLPVHPPVAPTPHGKVWKDQPTPLEAFVGAMLTRVRGLQRSFGLPDAMEMHDPVAIWYALCAAGLPAIGLGEGGKPEGWVMNQREFKVERIGELTRGMCVVDRRGSGEASGEDRTKGELGKGGAVPSLEVEKGRMGEDVVRPKNLPWVLVQSPGKDVLRKILLERVFGGSV